MTRDEVIRNLNMIRVAFIDTVTVEQEKLIDDTFIMTIKALEQEPTVAQERYEDLCEYFGDAKDILNNREDFKAWLGRVKWHIHKAEELYEKYEQEPIDKSAMMYKIYMEGVNMTGEYQGCWVRFKDIERIVDKYMGDI